MDRFLIFKMVTSRFHGRNSLKRSWHESSVIAVAGTWPTLHGLGTTYESAVVGTQPTLCSIGTTYILAILGRAVLGLRCCVALLRGTK